MVPNTREVHASCFVRAARQQAGGSAPLHGGTLSSACMRPAQPGAPACKPTSKAQPWPHDDTRHLAQKGGAPNGGKLSSPVSQSDSASASAVGETSSSSQGAPGTSCAGAAPAAVRVRRSPRPRVTRRLRGTHEPRHQNRGARSTRPRSGTPAEAGHGAKFQTHLQMWLRYPQSRARAIMSRLRSAALVTSLRSTRARFS